jgi:hypothetical protein
VKSVVGKRVDSRCTGEAQCFEVSIVLIGRGVAGGAVNHCEKHIGHGNF